MVNDDSVLEQVVEPLEWSPRGLGLLELIKDCLIVAVILEHLSVQTTYSKLGTGKLSSISRPSHRVTDSVRFVWGVSRAARWGLGAPIHSVRSLGDWGGYAKC